MSGVFDPEFSSLVDFQGNSLDINSDGSISNSLIDGHKATYSLCSSAITPATLATDIFTIYGSPTKVVRILRVEITGTQTTAGQVLMLLIKRESQNTGGTATTYLNWNGHDRLDPRATATVLQYSANPTTLGFGPTFIRSATLFIPGVATAAATVPTVWNFGDRPGKAVVLRDQNDTLAVNLNAVTITGGSFLISIEWTEE